MLSVYSRYMKISLLGDDEEELVLWADAFNEEQTWTTSILSRDLAEFLTQIVADRPTDVLIMKPWLGKSNALDYISKIKALLPDLKIIVISDDSDKQVMFRALQAGVNGYALSDGSDMSELVSIIQQIEQGETYIDPKLSQHIVEYFQEHPREESQSVQMLRDAWGLSFREAEVAQELMDGKPYKEIAARLNISLNTVRNHVKAIYQKVGVHNRYDLIRRVSG